MVTKYFKRHIVFSFSAILVSLLFYNGERRMLFPGTLNVESYDDTHLGGNSYISLDCTDTTLGYEYMLGDKLDYPFVGIKLQKDSSIDIEGFDRVGFEFIEVKSAKKIQAYYLKKSGTKNLRYNYVLSLAPNKTSLHCDLADFKIPSWVVLQDSLQDDLQGSGVPSHIESLVLSRDLLLRDGEIDNVTIKQIYFFSSNWWFYAFLVVALFGGNLIVFGWNKQQQSKVVVYEAVANHQTTYKDSSELELKQIIDFIGSHYQDSELTLKAIRIKLKIPENKISLLLKNEFGMSYKGYVTNIRLAEAKRLLKDSSLNVGEVASHTGFGSISTFNRVFKAEEGVTPSDFVKI